MKTILRLLLVLTLLPLATAAHAEEPGLWHGTRYGMSPAQVKAAVPHLSVPAKPSRLADGAVELLRLDDVEIAQNRFAAAFYFKGNKLTQVTLTVSKRNFDEAMIVFDDLTGALRSKYGKELTRTIERDKLNRADAIWMNGRTNIDVIAMSVGEHEAVLNINYQVRVAQDADRL